MLSIKHHSWCFKKTPVLQPQIAEGWEKHQETSCLPLILYCLYKCAVGRFLGQHSSSAVHAACPHGVVDFHLPCTQRHLFIFISLFQSQLCKALSLLPAAVLSCCPPWIFPWICWGGTCIKDSSPFELHGMDGNIFQQLYSLCPLE